MDTIFFVHIPKTAGTSFRVAAHKYFGVDTILADYGGVSHQSSESVKQIVYEQEDVYGLYSYMRDNNINMLTGHVNHGRYSKLFSALNVATFMRNPVDQVISHFKHYVHYHHYSECLDTFIADKRFINMQGRMLGSLPLELYGFLGVTEQYNDSIDLFNTCFGVNFEKLSLNIMSENAERRQADSSNEEASSVVRSNIAEINHLDMQKYERAKSVVNERLRLLKNGLPYHYGFAYFSSKNKIWGVAFGRDQDKPLDIEILRNDTVVETVAAKLERPHMRNFNTPRFGYVGFNYTFSKPLEKSENIVCRVQSTGQVIMSQIISDDEGQ